MDLFDLFARIRVDTSEFDSELSEASQKFSKAGEMIAKAGATLTKGVTLPIVGQIGRASCRERVSHQV